MRTWATKGAPEATLLPCRPLVRYFTEGKTAALLVTTPEEKAYAVKFLNERGLKHRLVALVK